MLASEGVPAQARSGGAVPNQPSQQGRERVLQLVREHCPDVPVDDELGGMGRRTRPKREAPDAITLRLARR